jgi:DNA-binding NtrC family response regulator
MLLGHNWRGNVRELENTIHRAVLLSHGSEVAPEAIRLPDGGKLSEGPIRTGSDPVAIATEAAATTTRALVGRTVSDVERDLILDTLGHCLGNRTHAANILGISIRTLRNKLREYSQAGIRVTQPGEGRAA